MEEIYEIEQKIEDNIRTIAGYMKPLLQADVTYKAEVLKVLNLIETEIGDIRRLYEEIELVGSRTE
jgi:hypothetical protein